MAKAVRLPDVQPERWHRHRLLRLQHLLGWRPSSKAISGTPASGSARSEALLNSANSSIFELVFGWLSLAVRFGRPARCSRSSTAKSLWSNISQTISQTPSSRIFSSLDGSAPARILHNNSDISFRGTLLSPKSARFRTSITNGARGQGLAEYLIIVAIIAVAVIFGVRYFGGSVTGQFQNATGKLDEISGEAAGGVATSGDPEQGAGTAETEKKSATSEVKQQISKRSIQEDTEHTELSELELDWRTLLFIGGIATFGGIALLFKAFKSKGKKKEKKRKKKRWFSIGAKNESGQAMTEFVLIAITFLFSILGLMQFAMILNAYTMVRYASYNAARAAIVHGGDLEKTHEAARLSLLALYPTHGRADNILGMVQNYNAATVTDKLPIFFAYNFGMGVFADPITEVKILPGRGRVSGEVVTFDDPLESEKGIITVQVSHNYHLVVPLANRIFFHIYNLFREKKMWGILASGYSGQTLDNIAATETRASQTGALSSLVEPRIGLTAHYTMRLHSDYTVP